MQRVCFDHLSGTPMAPELIEAMRPWWDRNFSGTGAVHSGGVAVRAALDEARERVARFVNAASPEEIIFTSSGTESLNLAVKGCALTNQKRGRKIVASAIEHPGILQSFELLQTLGFQTQLLPVSSEGFIDPEALRAALDDETILVCLHAGHHDIGAIQNLPALSDIVSERGIDLLIDATYAAGWVDVDVRALNASYVAIAPHRFRGPKGVGILYKQRRARLTPLIHGGAQELGWRAGTENIPGIIAAGLACELPHAQRRAHVAQLQAKMWQALQSRLSGLRLNGPLPGPTRLPNSLNISLTGLEGEGLALALDMKGYAITSGQACATKATKLPPTLAALNVPEQFGPGTIILSFDLDNSSEQVDRFMEILVPKVEKLRALNA